MTCKIGYYKDGEWQPMECWSESMKFLRLRGGRLEVMPRESVLLALRRLAAGLPSAARDGPELPRRRRSSPPKRRKSSGWHRVSKCRHRRNRGAFTVRTYGIQTSPTPTPHPDTRDAASSQKEVDALKEADNLQKVVQTSQKAVQTSQKVVQTSQKEACSVLNKERNVNNDSRACQTDSVVRGTETESSNNTPRLRSHKAADEENVPLEQVGGGSAIERRTRSKKNAEESIPQQETSSKESSQSESEGSSVSPRLVELEISESDVMLFRGHLAATRGDVCLHRFDNDPAYRLELMYQIQPLVRLVRDPRVTTLAKQALKARSQPSPSHTTRTRNQKENLPRSCSQTRKRKRIVSSASDGTCSDSSNCPRSGEKSAGDGRTKVPKISTNGPEENLIGPKDYPNVGKGQKDSSKGSKDSSKVGDGQKDSSQVSQGSKDGTKVSTQKSDVVSSGGVGCGPKQSAGPRVNVARPKVVKQRRWLNMPSGGREYSSFEDQAIVAWLNADVTRERRVNGNALWRDLQQQYKNITGQERTWHSLRNRYLRYLLPALSSLALPPDIARRMRAHAAMGLLKAGKLVRRNSMAERAATALRGKYSAWSRRPRDRPPERRSRSSSTRSRSRSGSLPTRESRAMRTRSRSEAKSPSKTKLRHTSRSRSQNKSPNKKSRNGRSKSRSTSRSSSLFESPKNHSPSKLATRSSKRFRSRTRSRSADKKSPHKRSEVKSPKKKKRKSGDNSPSKSRRRSRSETKSPSKRKSQSRRSSSLSDVENISSESGPDLQLARRGIAHRGEGEGRTRAARRRSGSGGGAVPLSYSEITRRFALRHRGRESTPTTDGDLHKTDVDSGADTGNTGVVTRQSFAASLGLASVGQDPRRRSARTAAQVANERGARPNKRKLFNM